MASVESIPAYLQPGVAVSQPPHLEGDPSLATEILPGPPSLASIQQAGLPRKDHKKASVSFSYLPSADPGTTYTTHFAMNPLSAAPVDIDGTRRKRARLDKGYVCTFSITNRPYLNTLDIVPDLLCSNDHPETLLRKIAPHPLAPTSTAPRAAGPNVHLLAVWPEWRRRPNLSWCRKRPLRHRMDCRTLIPNSCHSTLTTPWYPGQPLYTGTTRHPSPSNPPLNGNGLGHRRIKGRERSGSGS